MTKYKEGDLVTVKTPIEQLRRMATKDENGLLPCRFCGHKAYTPMTYPSCDDVDTFCKNQNCRIEGVVMTTKRWNELYIDAPALLAEIDAMQAKLRDAEEALRWYATTDAGVRARDYFEKHGEKNEEKKSP